MKHKNIWITGLVVCLSLVVLWFPDLQKIYGKVGWILFFFVMIARPAFDLSRETAKAMKFWLKIMRVRQIMAIVATVFIYAHVAGVMVLYKMNASDLFSAASWDFSTLWGWGMLGAAIMLPLFFTSNTWSMRKLKKYWKLLQKTAYIAFIAAGVHGYLAGEEGPAIIMTGIWAFLWGLAWRKNRKRKVE